MFVSDGASENFFIEVKYRGVDYNLEGTRLNDFENNKFWRENGFDVYLYEFQNFGDKAKIEIYECDCNTVPKLIYTSGEESGNEAPAFVGRLEKAASIQEYINAITKESEKLKRIETLEQDKKKLEQDLENAKNSNKNAEDLQAEIDEKQKEIELVKSYKNDDEAKYQKLKLQHEELLYRSILKVLIDEHNDANDANTTLQQYCNKYIEDILVPAIMEYADRLKDKAQHNELIDNIKINGDKYINLLFSDYIKLFDTFQLYDVLNKKDKSLRTSSIGLTQYRPNLLECLYSFLSNDKNEVVCNALKGHAYLCEQLKQYGKDKTKS